MKPQKVPSSTGDLGPPPGVSDEECGHLPYRREAGAFVSVWKPSEEELAVLVAGGNVELGVHSGAHPPVSLSVTDETGEDVVPAADAIADAFQGAAE